MHVFCPDSVGKKFSFLSASVTNADDDELTDVQRPFLHCFYGSWQRFAKHVDCTYLCTKMIYSANCYCFVKLRINNNEENKVFYEETLKLRFFPSRGLWVNPGQVQEFRPSRSVLPYHFMLKGMAQLPSSSTLKLEGKIAIVTGGASGIGEATARLFADHGVKAVVIADIQDEKGLEVAESIGKNRCSYFHCNVNDEKQVKSMVEWTVQTYGKLDIMCSNAGIVSKSNQTILDLDFSELDHLFGVNVRGMAACVKHGARAMVEQRVRGTIVCTASVAASRGGARRTDYIMGKHAVVGLVRSASIQLGEHGIRVNSVSPSAVTTPIGTTTAYSLQKRAEEIERIYGPLTSLKGIHLSVRHVAEAVLFLVSEDSAFITGQDLAVDGGLLSLPTANYVVPDANSTTPESRPI